VGVVLDSDVIVGFLDRDDSLHHAANRRIRELAGEQAFVASVVSYAELLTGAELGQHPREVVQGFFDDLVDDIVAVDLEVAQRAAQLRAGKKALRMPDALILATADLHPDVRLVVCGDERWAAVHLPNARVELLRP
jgi:predicted nucleic acid-binding protein